MSSPSVDGAAVLAEARRAEAFSFVDAEVDGAEIVLRYALGDVAFTERFVLPAPLPESPAAARAVRVLHLAAGVSYAKVAAPVVLDVGPTLDEPLVRWVAATYDHGLRELAVTNGLPVPLPVELRTHERRGVAASSVDGDPPVGVGAVVPVGGGKDSALVAHLLPDADLLTVNPRGAQHRLAERLGRPLLAVERHLDPLLRDLNEAGATNGHVPVTNIVAAASVCAALALGRRDVVFGNERSASEPTRHVDGFAVNHQWSKSLQAERLLAAALAPTGVRCFSLLRPLTEVAIARAVARLGLVPDVLSCNNAFTLWRPSDAADTQTWCGDCPKCRFAYLVLAPHTPRDELVGAFGRDLLDDPAQLDGFRDLYDTSAKPYECVGELAESALSMAVLGGRPEWASRAVVAELAPTATDGITDRTIDLSAGAEAALEALARAGGEDLVPDDYRSVLAGLDDEGGSDDAAR